MQFFPEFSIFSTKTNAKISKTQLAHFVDLEKCCKMNIWLQKSVLIQPRTSPPNGLEAQNFRVDPTQNFRRNPRFSDLGVGWGVLCGLQPFQGSSPHRRLEEQRRDARVELLGARAADLSSAIWKMAEGLASEERALRQGRVLPRPRALN